MRSPSRSLRHHLRDQVTIYPYLGTSYRGQQQWGNPFTLDAFIAYRHRMIDFPSGESRISRAEVYVIIGDSEIKSGDQVEFPSGSKFEVLTVSSWTTAPWVTIEV